MTNDTRTDDKGKAPVPFDGSTSTALARARPQPRRPSHAAPPPPLGFDQAETDVRPVPLAGEVLAPVLSPFAYAPAEDTGEDHPEDT